jgi:rod shape-determining protein MreC
MNKTKISTIIIITVMGLLLLQSLFLHSKNNFVSNAASYITKPVGSVFAGTGWWFRNKIQFFTSIGNLKQNNQKLFDENLGLRAKIATLAEVEKENEVLRSEIALAPREKHKLEAAIIIGRESGSYSEVVYVNKGEKNEIKEGMAVLVGEGILIGQVVEVTTNTAKIQLITDKNFKVNSKLIESDGHGVTFGQYGTSARMKMIPQTIKINKGDTVVTSKLSDNFKSDLLIGYVQEVFNTADGLFQEVTVLLPRELDNLYLVQILKE